MPRCNVIPRIVGDCEHMRYARTRMMTEMIGLDDLKMFMKVRQRKFVGTRGGFCKY